MFSTPASTILVAKQEAATLPMELGKAYMDSKSSNKGSSPSSALRLHTPIYTDRKPSPFLADVTHASAKSSGSGLALVARQNATPFSPVFDRSRDGFATPRSLGRTAISRMCRSPFVKRLQVLLAVHTQINSHLRYSNRKHIWLNTGVEKRKRCALRGNRNGGPDSQNQTEAKHERCTKRACTKSIQEFHSYKP